MQVHLNQGAEHTNSFVPHEHEFPFWDLIKYSGSSNVDFQLWVLSISLHAFQSDIVKSKLLFFLLFNLKINKQTFIYRRKSQILCPTDTVISQKRRSQHPHFNYALQCLTFEHMPKFDMNLTLSLTTPPSHQLSIFTFTDAVLLLQFQGVRQQSVTR